MSDDPIAIHCGIDKAYKGSCLCGQVTFEVKGLMNKSQIAIVLCAENSMVQPLVRWLVFQA